MRHLLSLAVAGLLVAAPLSAQQQPAPQQSGQPAPAASTEAELIARAQLDGQNAAMNVGTGGWATGGFVSGLFVGLIGTGVTWAMAGSSNVELPPDKRLQIASSPASYQQLYERAFAEKVKSKRKSSALKGGLLGTATFVLLIVSASGSSQ